MSEDQPIVSEFAEPFEALLGTETTLATIDKALEDGSEPDWFDAQLAAVYERETDGFKWPVARIKNQTRL